MRKVSPEINVSTNQSLGTKLIDHILKAGMPACYGSFLYRRWKFLMTVALAAKGICVTIAIVDKSGICNKYSHQTENTCIFQD